MISLSEKRRFRKGLTPSSSPKREPGPPMFNMTIAVGGCFWPAAAAWEANALLRLLPEKEVSMAKTVGCQQVSKGQTLEWQV